MSKPLGYKNEKALKKKILGKSNKEAEEKGVCRPTLWRIKKRIDGGRKLIGRLRVLENYLRI